MPLLVAVAVAARAITFGNPIVHVDEQFYFVVARAMAHGALPYVDIWDRKPIGLFLLYLPAASLPWRWGIWAYQMQALVFVVATAWLIAWLAAKAGWARGATLAGLAYIVWLDLAEGEGGQSPVFYNLLMAGAAALIVVAQMRRAAPGWRGMASMLLVGLALQIKYSVVFEGVFFGLWLLWLQWRATHRRGALIGYGVALVALALLPTAFAFGAYAAIGQAQAFAYANFTSILQRSPDGAGEAFGNLAVVLLLVAPFVGMAIGTQRLGTAEGDAGVRRFLFLWFGAAIVGLLAFGSWFDHYALPSFVPGAACAAGFLGHGRVRGRAGPAILLLAALIGQVSLVGKRAGRGTPAQFQAVADAVGRGPDCLYVYSGEPMLYAATGRCALSRYLFPSHLGRVREAGAIGVAQATEVRRILAARPAVVVMRPPYRGERPEIRAIVAAEMMRRYAPPQRVQLGNQIVSIFRVR